MSIPFFDYVSERDQLKDWAFKKGEVGLKEFWEERNQISLDGKPTHILEKMRNKKIKLLSSLIGSRKKPRAPY